MGRAGLILLDRDGVLNRMVVDPDHGTIDSPLHPSQVEIVHDAPEALARLNQLGYGLVICTNQPAAAKGKTTRLNLEATHAAVLSELEKAGVVVLSSHICFHTAEHRCPSRKPAPGLLLDALLTHPEYDREQSWMVGDGVTDMQAGYSAQLKTAFIAPKKLEACRILGELAVTPSFWGENLSEFVDHLSSIHREAISHV